MEDMEPESCRLTSREFNVVLFFVPRQYPSWHWCPKKANKKTTWAGSGWKNVLVILFSLQNSFFYLLGFFDMKLGLQTCVPSCEFSSGNLELQ